MIPVAPAAEPASFDTDVRQPGLKWLADEGLTGTLTAPVGKKIRAMWTNCLPDLMSAYGSICAYASLRIPPVTGARSVEHFAPKSRALDQTYEWSNYRLACAKLNARKNNFTDVLDPFGLAPGTFILNAVSGALSPAPGLATPDLALAEITIKRLKLDDREMRRARTNLITAYFEGMFKSAWLRVESPFIFEELHRQGLLRA